MHQHLQLFLKGFWKIDPSGGKIHNRFFMKTATLTKTVNKHNVTCKHKVQNMPENTSIKLHSCHVSLRWNRNFDELFLRHVHVQFTFPLYKLMYVE